MNAPRRAERNALNGAENIPVLQPTDCQPCRKGSQEIVSLSQSAPFTKTDRNFVQGVDSAFFRKAGRRTHKSARQSATTSATVTGVTFPTVIAAKISEAVSGSDETS